MSIVVPVYNERYTVVELVDSLFRVALPVGVTREVILIDDASSDGTREILRELEQKHPLRIHYQSENQGKGSAVRKGIELASGDVIVVQDADLEYDPGELPKLLRPILDGHADVVYGSRFLAGEYRRVLYFWHTVGNRILTLWSNFFTNLNLTDIETCYKMVRAPILKSIPIRSNRFGMEPELTAKFAKRGCRIYEVAISYRGRSYREGKKITPWDGVKALFTIVYFWLVDDLYTEQYGHAILHQLSKTHRFNNWLADTIRPWVGEHVIEFGAGLGNLSRQLLPRDSYCASDIDPLHLDYLSNVFENQPSVSVCKADIEKSEDFVELEGRFDTAVALNVVEHVEDDKQALANIFSALRPGGRACILVPRSRRLFGSFDELLGHFRRYTPTQLRSGLEEAGFEIEKELTFNRISVPGWFINAVVLRRKSFGRLQLKLFDSTVWLWRRLDPFLPWKGLSLVMIARRPAADPSSEASQAAAPPS
ncbi:MAG TPA: glycosyltransferase [Acidobacteriota bacterium]|nr:glycosyltransferase [Acidobacteriota bacterium]